MLVLVYGGIPPSFRGIQAYENTLPQHNWSKGVESKLSGAYDEKYLSFPDHMWGHGFNNILQEILLTSYVAYATNRTFVFDDYVWSHLPTPYTLYDFALRPTHIPLNAFISGPSAGGDVPTSMHRAISTDYFEYICPPKSRVSITYSSSSVGEEANGVDIVNWWRKRLNEDDVRHISCLQIREEKSRVFDANFFGSPRILPLFPDLRDSPILANFTWSPLINSALQKTVTHLFSSTHTSNHIAPGVIAIHLRRGDYKRHCLRLAKWGSTYMGFNQFDGLVDSFDSNSTVDEYLQHCLPTIPQIVHRLNEIRAEYPSPLTQVYIMTNAWPSYISTLSSALQADRWKSVSSTPDIDSFLNPEQRLVNVAVDMALAVDKAEVFVGNGFSSLTANVVMLRMAKGFPARSNRFL
ncbi:hypothetical protein BYT27DRAFT_7114216 [Phlegmacium glaucopus]|nr:hypothetical protein BYT27DRAFT_7114216 [Phlegmacium glaucopus]